MWAAAGSFRGRFLLKLGSIDVKSRSIISTRAFSPKHKHKKRYDRTETHPRTNLSILGALNHLQSCRDI
jgi:hypothetical protein